MKNESKSKAQLMDELKSSLERIKELEDAEIERKKAEEAYRSLMAHSLQGLTLIQDRRIIFANLAFVDMSGYALTELFSFSTDDIKATIHPDDRARVWKDLKNRLTGKHAPSRYEFRFIRKDGSVCWVDTLVSFVEYRNKSALQMTYIDITERKEAEMALKEEKDLISKYLDIAGVIFVVIGTEQKVTLINKKGCEVLGYDYNEIVGENWFDKFIPKKLKDEVKSVFVKLINGEIEPVEYFENPVVTKTGEEKIIAWHNTYLTDDKGNITGTLSSGEDITARKKAEQKVLEERNRSELYLDLLGHDINNNIQAIISSNELLLMNADLKDEFRKYVQNSLSNAKAIAELISNVHKLSELQQKPVELEKIEASQMLVNAIKNTQEMFDDRDIDVSFTKPKTKIHIKSNKLIKYAFENILNNAVKFNRNKNVVLEISHERADRGKYWKFEFKDNGPGVPNELKKSISNGLEGRDIPKIDSGLGLILVNEVVKQSGGKLFVEDRIKGKPEKGSNFIILLKNGGQ